MWSAKIEGVVREGGRDLYVLTVRKGGEERPVKKSYSELADLESSLSSTNSRTKIALPEEYRLSGLLSSRILLSEYFDKLFASGEDSTVDRKLSQFFDFNAGTDSGFSVSSQLLKSRSGTPSTDRFDAGRERDPTPTSGLLGSLSDSPSKGNDPFSSWSGLDTLSSTRNSQKSEVERALSSFRSNGSLYGSPGMPPPSSRDFSTRDYTPQRDFRSDFSVSSSRASSVTSRAPSVTSLAPSTRDYSSRDYTSRDYTPKRDSLSTASSTSSLLTTLMGSSRDRELEAERRAPARLASSIGGLFATSTYDFTSILNARDAQRSEGEPTSPSSSIGSSMYTTLQTDGGSSLPSMRLGDIFSKPGAPPPRADITSSFTPSLASLRSLDSNSDRHSDRLDASSTSSRVDLHGTRDSADSRRSTSPARSTFSSSILDFSSDAREKPASKVPDMMADAEDHSPQKVGEAPMSNRSTFSDATFAVPDFNVSPREKQASSAESAPTQNSREPEKTDVDNEPKVRSTLSSRLFAAPASDFRSPRFEQKASSEPKKVAKEESQPTHSAREAEKTDGEKESKRSTGSSLFKVPALDLSAAAAAAKKKAASASNKKGGAESFVIHEASEAERAEVDEELSRALSGRRAKRELQAEKLQAERMVPKEVRNANREEKPASDVKSQGSPGRQTFIDDEQEKEMSKMVSGSSTYSFAGDDVRKAQESAVRKPEVVEQNGLREEAQMPQSATKKLKEKAKDLADGRARTIDKSAPPIVTANPTVDEKVSLDEKKPILDVSIATPAPTPELQDSNPNTARPMEFAEQTSEQNAAKRNSSNAERVELGEKTSMSTSIRSSSKSPKPSPRVTFSSSAYKTPEAAFVPFVGDGSNASILEEVGRLQATLQKIGPQLKEQQAALKEHFTMRQEGLDTHYMAKRLQSVQKFNIIGIDQQVVHINLDSSQTICAEPGCLIQSDPDVRSMLDDGASGCFACFGSLCCASKPSTRIYSTNEAQADKVVCFGPKFPAKVVPISLSEWNQEILVKQHAFLAATDPHLKMDDERAGWKGDSHGKYSKLCKRLSGEGLVFVAAAGAVFLKVLRPGDQIVVDSACVVAWQPTCQLSSRAVEHVNGCCGGKRLSENLLAGPGKLILQSMPYERGHAFKEIRVALTDGATQS